MKNWRRRSRALLGVALVLVLLGLIGLWLQAGPAVEDLRYSSFLAEVKNAQVASVVLQGDMIYGVRKDHTQFEVYNPETDYTALIRLLMTSRVAIEGRSPTQPSPSDQMLTRVLELLLVVGVVFGVLRIQRARRGSGTPPPHRASRVTAIGLSPDKAAADRATGRFTAITHQGGRPQVIELQTRVDPVPTGAPYRNVQGIDAGRVARLIAVLSHHSAYRGLRGHDVSVSTVGGIVHDPAADLPLLLALASSRRGCPLPAQWLAFGEIDLAGEVHAVPDGEERLRLAHAQGFQTAIVPQGNAPQGALPGLTVIAVSHLEEAIRAAFAGPSARQSAPAA